VAGEPSEEPTGGFETEEAARAEDRLRARRIRRVLNRPGHTNWLNIKDRLWLATQRLPRLCAPPMDAEAAERLARKLQDGVASGFPTPSLASSMAMRTTRQSVIGALLQALDGYADADLRTFTIVNTKWALTPEQLDAIGAVTIRNQLRTHLIRVGVLSMPGPLVAFLHGEIEPAEGIYQLHWHGVATGDKAAALHRLKDITGYERTRTGAAPVRCEQVNDRPHQFSYMLKSYWPSRAVRMVDGERKRDRKGGRIPEPFHSQVLLWLDRQKLADMTLLNGCWSPRKRGTPAMRALYLLVHGR
jgi:hypothetical protein